MSWSKIQASDLALEAYLKITNNFCNYHNIQHVNSMYDYLEYNEVPYDEAIDWAIMFHDSIYDSEPKKEKRSAEFFINSDEKYRGCGLDAAGRLRVYDLIMATENHLIDDLDKVKPLKGKKEIIMADLHQLTNPRQVVVNYANIMQESITLYDIDEFTFARENIKYMQSLRDRMMENIKRADTVKDKSFFSNVVEGINTTILFSRAIL